MKNLLNYTALILLSTVLVFVSCDKDDDNEPPVNDDVVMGTIIFDATAYDKWTYFSFADTQIVEVNDYLTSLDWDIGFHRFDVRVNCGTSGSGQGGSLNAGEIDFSSITEAPESGYSLNDSIDIMQEAGNWVYEAVPGDTILASWLTFTGPPPTYTVNDNIYIIKTADGKYAKIWLKDYYNDNSETGHITMKYVFQPDGSIKLE